MKVLTTIKALSCALVSLCSTQTNARDIVSPAEKKLSFSENVGQVTDQYFNSRKDIQFKMQAGSMNVFIGNGRLHYQWYQTKNDPAGKTGEVNTYRMDVVLAGANTHAEVVKEEMQTGYEQFYHPHLGLSGDKAFSYNRVTYRNIYPNIDWVLYSSKNQLKYDFVVHPGGDPADIQLQYKGGTVSLNNGSLTAATPMGTVTEDRPYSYDAETKKEIPSSFVLNGDVLSFNISAVSNTIVIDPAISWITYYGGLASGTDEWSQGVATDSAGNVYIAGATTSAGNIATTGAFQATYGGNSDGYVAKLNAAGVRQWATYYGNTGSEMFSDVAVSGNGDIFLTGFGGPGLATAGAYMTAPGAGSEMLIVKFNNSGARQWATYYWGNVNNYYPNQICCDPAGNIFVNYSNQNLSYYGLFVAKLLANGTHQWNVIWGSGDDRPTDITSDLAGNVYATSTYGVPGNGHFVRFDTYGIKTMDKSIGGANHETLNSIAVDAGGNIYVTGMTNSPTGIATTGAWRTTIVPPATMNSYDNFLMKYNSSGTLQWGTYMGPNPGDTWHSKVTAGMPGKVYVSGGHSSGGPSFVYEVTTANGYVVSDITLSGDYGVKWYSNSAWCPTNGMLYIVGHTQSTTGLATPGAHQTTISGGEDPYIAAIRVDTIVYVAQPFNDTVLCAGQAVNLPYGTSFNFGTGNTFTAWLSDAAGSFASPTNIGSLSSSAAGTISCTIPLSTAPGNGYRIRITAGSPVYVSFGNDKNIRVDSVVTHTVNLTASPGVNAGPWTPVTFTANTTGTGASPVYEWRKNGVVISGATTGTYVAVTGVDIFSGDTISVSVTGSLPCASPAIVTSSQTVNVNLGVDDPGITGSTLYPNPTTGTLSLSGTSGDEKIEIINVSGQVVQTATASAGTTEIILDEKLSNGLYILRLTSGDNTELMKFSLNR